MLVMQQAISLLLLKC